LRPDKTALRQGLAQGEIMFLASRIEWAGIVFTLLTTAMLVQGFPRSAAASDSPHEGVGVFVMNSEIMKMQEALRDRGHYRGKVDGVFGLRTRASIRAYQKTENFPVTGQVDKRTADGLGVRPESNWNQSVRGGGEVGHRSDRTGNEVGKPSANINWTHGSRRTSKTLGKPIKTVATPENRRADSAQTLQAESDSRPH
jgi:peptidoglycan hydrolase-like protein with peptidoglycan-binding domain